MTQVKSSIAFLILISLSAVSDAYVIYNDTSRPLEFRGQWCSTCFHEKIYHGKSAACPGNETGCGGDTRVYSKYGIVSEDPLWSDCWARSPTPVPQYGEVHFYDDKVEVFDATGRLLQSSPYMFEYEEGIFDILTEAKDCWYQKNTAPYL